MGDRRRMNEVMISLDAVSKHYGPRVLFDSVSLRIEGGNRIAVVGRNGAGKTTLLRILAGLIEPDGGTIHRDRYTTIGYLPQDGVRHSGHTVFEETAQALDDSHRLRRRIEVIGYALDECTANGTAVDELLEELKKTQDRLETSGGYALEYRVEKILFGLGFTAGDLERMTDEFSGGWQMRLAMAKLLLQEPSLLLLDEPTNHLDIVSLEWLESYLKAYRGALLLVSHDSRFLDNLVSRTVELCNGRVDIYRGNYSSYRRQRDERRVAENAAKEHRKRVVEETLQFAERFRYKATKAKQVQSRLKRIKDMTVAAPVEKNRVIAFSFPEVPRSGRVVVDMRNVDKSYGSRRIFSDLTLTIERGDRIALMGANGTGKSTLARIIAGEETYDTGTVTWGHNVSMAFYSQHQADILPPQSTVWEIMAARAPERTQTELRTLLGSFLFSGDDVDKPVSVLSGGEKSRLAIACLLLIPANLFVLDEPTNHLDETAKKVLCDRLEDFHGTLLIAGHDRDFLAPLMKKVVMMSAERIDIYYGTVDECLEKQHREQEAAARRHLPSDLGTAPGSSERERKRREAERRQERSRRLKPLYASLQRIEEEITLEEKRRESIEASFADQSTYDKGNDVDELSIEHAASTRRLEELYERWAWCDEQIETIKKTEP